MNTRLHLATVLVFALLLSTAGTVRPGRADLLDSIFTYQGQLDQNGSPVDGTCDFELRFFDAPSGGPQIGVTQTAAATLNDGLFTVLVNGGSAFQGEKRYLDVGVRCPAGAGSFVHLSPRQQLTAAPYALYAPAAGQAGDVSCSGCVDSADIATAGVSDQNLASGIAYNKLSGAPSSLPPSGPAGGSLAGTYPNPGLAGDSVGSAQIQAGAVATAEIAATSIVTSHLGSDVVTSDKIASGTIQQSDLAFTPGTVTWVTAGSGLTGGTITTGGTIAADFGSGSGTIAEGDHNHQNTFWSLNGNSGTITGTHFLGTIDQKPLEFLVGGLSVLRMERADDTLNLVAGAPVNTHGAGIVGITISGGGSGGNPNQVHSNYGTVGGGRNNQAWGTATVGGGQSNQAGNFSATVGGGFGNQATDTFATVGGGENNSAGGSTATVGGGSGNNAASLAGTVGGGSGNTVFGDYATIGGGRDNQTMAAYATIAGGGPSDPANSATSNRVTDDYGTIGGGGDNLAGDNAGSSIDAVGATVSGGGANAASGPHSTVGGGFLNAATGNQSTICGGIFNLASGTVSTVAGGTLNSAEGLGSFAAGVNAHASHDGSFVWSDGTTAAGSLGTHSFNAVATGGFRFFFDAVGNSCDLNSTSGWVCSGASDHNAKANIADVDGREILERLAAIPIQTWTYKSQPNPVRHIGPMAQNFHAAFQVGEDDRSISTVDADGVAMAAIQALYRAMQETDAEIAALRERNAALAARVDTLEQVALQGPPLRCYRPEVDGCEGAAGPTLASSPSRPRAFEGR